MMSRTILNLPHHSILFVLGAGAGSAGAVCSFASFGSTLPGSSPSVAGAFAILASRIWVGGFAVSGPPLPERKEASSWSNTSRLPVFLFGQRMPFCPKTGCKAQLPRTKTRQSLGRVQRAHHLSSEVSSPPEASFGTRRIFLRGRCSGLLAALEVQAAVHCPLEAIAF
jgi:hypothetical protein